MYDVTKVKIIGINDLNQILVCEVGNESRKFIYELPYQKRINLYSYYGQFVDSAGVTVYEPYKALRLDQYKIYVEKSSKFEKSELVQSFRELNQYKSGIK